LIASLQALVFDFDGVIANSEPLHLRAFQRTLARFAGSLTADEYFARYLGFDDVGVFTEFGKDRGLRFGEDDVRRLVAEKAEHLQRLTSGDGVLFPGAKEFIRTAASAVPVAIASGALRHEIEEVLQAAGLASFFPVIVASGDTPQSKPSPDPYDLAFRRLQDIAGKPLLRHRCVAIEDSRWGLESARGAGLRCVGVTNSYPAHELHGAELVAGGLNELTLEALDELCRRDLP
jgi:beta-phosphoglucomutase-like phosphatase (HAD superfamily)